MTRVFLRGFWLATLALIQVGAIALLLGVAIAYGPEAWQDYKPLDYGVLAFTLSLYAFMVYRASARSGITEVRPYLALCAGVLALNLLLEGLFLWDPMGWTASDPGDPVERCIELANYPALVGALYAGFVFRMNLNG